MRFDHVHLDLVGPLPPSKGKSYCLTMIDRYTRWPEAIPIEDIKAETVAQAFYDCWITRFGVPSRVTTDQGRQFESSLFRSLSRLLGIKRIRSSPYHPQANGLIEEFHRPLKTVIKAHNTERWTEVLSTILLGFRSVFKEDIQCTTAELVYGTTLRLPGEMFWASPVEVSQKQLVEDLKEYFSSIRPKPTSCHGERPVFVHPHLKDCTHVFVRNDRVPRPLQQPYDGPFKVIKRGDKTFVVDVRGRKATISLDRLKPAYIVLDSQEHDTPAVITKDVSSSSGTSKQKSTTTRSGRVVKFPQNFVSYR
ncbi:pol polyprotein [Lasius niger]|uniref:Pol polyprotein n=1 Tax=Lasius niger TaxID=67767 RepID=A0A0J7JXC2_LASNI|nr:pol polyprotein [Lasius niger]